MAAKGRSVYERVARKIEAQIRNRTLRPGDRLPSLRMAHRETGASLTSVLRAYVLLENEGLIESRPQSGFYVRAHQFPTAVPEPSLFPREPIDELVVSSFIRATSDPTAISLAEATPCVRLLPTKTLARLLGRACRERPEALLLFEHPQGNVELRRQLAKRSLASGRGYAEDDIVITNGGMESWNLCLRAVAMPGEAVLVESPTYFGVGEILRGFGIEAVEFPADPDPLRLEELFRARKIRAALVMPNFAKPGRPPWEDAQKRAIVSVFARHRVALIEDDIYGDLSLEGKKPATLKDFDETGIVLHCGSFSKTVAPGFRVSWVVAGRFKDAIVRLKFLTSMASPTIAQMVLAEYLAHGSFERHLRQVRRTLCVQLASYEKRVRRYFPPGTEVFAPAAGFALWARLPEERDAVALYRAALRENILLAPGPIFSPFGDLRDFVRINFGQRYTPKIDEALAKVGGIAQRLGPYSAIPGLM